MHPCHELLHGIVPFPSLQLYGRSRAWLGRDRNVSTPTLEGETEVTLGEHR
jgi:hypothetical protein